MQTMCAYIGVNILIMSKMITDIHNAIDCGVTIITQTGRLYEIVAINCIFSFSALDSVKILECVH